MPCWLKLGSITTVAITLNWVQYVGTTTEYAHGLSPAQVILIVSEARQNRPVRSKQESFPLIKLCQSTFFLGGWDKKEKINICYKISDHNVNPRIMLFTEKNLFLSSCGVAHPLAYAFNSTRWNRDVIVIHACNPNNEDGVSLQKEAPTVESDI